MTDGATIKDEQAYKLGQALIERLKDLPLEERRFVIAQLEFVFFDLKRFK